MHTAFVRLHQQRRYAQWYNSKGAGHKSWRRHRERAGSCQCSRNLKSSRRARDANKWSSTAPGPRVNKFYYMRSLACFQYFLHRIGIRTWPFSRLCGLKRHSSAIISPLILCSLGAWEAVDILKVCPML